ncbi:MAG TPA: OmpA family protein [Polyangiaceae bacterium]|nr:OmpA family protein [Polyangiaceae bacterium]
MQNVLRHAALVTLLAPAACGPHERRPPAAPAAPAPAAPTPEPRPEASAPRADATSVWVDPAIVSACGLKPQQAFFDFDSDARDPERQRVMDAIAACLSSGPLKGRALRLVGHAGQRELNAPGKRADKVRTDSIADYLTNMGLERSKLRTGSHGDEKTFGIDGRGWSYEQRVDIRLAE